MQSEPAFNRESIQSQLDALKGQLEKPMLGARSLPDRQRILKVNGYDEKLQDLRRQIESQWSHLLITQRDENSNRPEDVNARSNLEYKLFDEALDLFPLASGLAEIEKLLSDLREQTYVPLAGTVDTGLQALQSGDLPQALVRLASANTPDVKIRVQNQRETEARRLLERAQALLQQPSDQEPSQIYDFVKRNILEPVHRIGREFQRETARQLLNFTPTVDPPLLTPDQDSPDSDASKISSNFRRWWPVVALLTVLACSGALFFSIWVEGDVTGTPTPPTGSPPFAVAKATATAGSSAIPVAQVSPALPSVTSLGVTPSTLLPPTFTPTNEQPEVSATPTLPPTPPVTIPLPPSPDLIKIALQSPQSGEWSSIGVGVLHGAEFSIEQQNTPLTKLGYRLELAGYDDEANREKGIANAQALIADPDVLCLVGHFNSGVTLGAYEAVYKGSNLVVISPGATNPTVTDNTENVWRVVGRDDVQGVVGAQFARDPLGSKSVYIIHDGTTYGRSIANFFRLEAQTNGGPTVLQFANYDDNQSEPDFTTFVNEIQTLKPDLIFFAGAYSRAGVFFKLVRERGIVAQLMGTDSIDNPELATIAGPAVDGMHFTTVAAPVSAFPNAAQFSRLYKERFDVDAPSFSPESYDATTLCILAIARAASANGGEKPTRQQVLEAMRDLSDERFPGISGNYRFNANGDPLSVGYFVVQVNAADWSQNRVVKQLTVPPPSN
jgi:ABC-type branched-subunit amino acid transport system substrate-binding protein